MAGERPVLVVLNGRADRSGRILSRVPFPRAIALPLGREDGGVMGEAIEEGGGELQHDIATNQLSSKVGFGRRLTFVAQRSQGKVACAR